MNENAQTKNKRIGTALVLMTLVGLFLLQFEISMSTPDGATGTVIENRTGAAGNGTNISGVSVGGYIYTVNFSGVSQTTRWQAYVGNVSGRLTLDDASGNTIYDWTLLSASGEVYATRNGTNPINWAEISCANVTEIDVEEAALSHTDPSDNISATFNITIHPQYDVGTVTINANTCWATRTYINDVQNASTAIYDEIILHDENSTVFATGVNFGETGFDDRTYDFQMILPDHTSGSIGTQYYFYLELS